MLPSSYQGAADNNSSTVMPNISAVTSTICGLEFVVRKKAWRTIGTPKHRSVLVIARHPKCVLDLAVLFPYLAAVTPRACIASSPTCHQHALYCCCTLVLLLYLRFCLLCAEPSGYTADGHISLSLYAISLFCQRVLLVCAPSASAARLRSCWRVHALSPPPQVT